MSNIPADLDAERALITAALLTRKAFLDVTSMITPEDFFKPAHQNIWAAMEQIAPETDDPILVAARLRDNGFEGDEYTAQAMNAYYCDPNVPATCTSHAPQYARRIIAEAIRRRLIHTLSQSMQDASGGGLDAAIIREDLISKLEQLSTPTEIRTAATADEVANATSEEYNWLIDGFLERGDRVMLTGAEGAGKSMLLVQIAFMAAAGIHPWTLRAVEPVRVLMVDLENNERMITRRIRVMQKAIEIATKRGLLAKPWDDGRMLVEPRSEGINIAERVDRDWLSGLCLGGNVDLLVVGPAYRMTKGVAAKGDMGGEDQARTVSAAIDAIRQRCNVTVLIETHAAHGGGGGRERDLRPFGSSVWLRWPEFGVGLRKAQSDDRRQYELDHWRGPRDDRIWPKMLLRNSAPWPWQPVID